MTEAVGALLLAPGAGSDAAHPALVAVESAVAPLPVARFDFPYRKEGRAFPDRAPKLIETVRSEAEALVDRAGIDPGGLALGGRSMGGRMCSMAVAEGLSARALVLIGYPLHPAKKSDKLRVDHFPDLELPCLFVSGTRDSFATPDELTEHVAAVPGPVTVKWVEGGRHELKGADAEVADLVAAWLAGLG